MLTPMERKRQGYIHELIVTEENYVNDLQLVTEVRAETTLWLVCRNLKLNIVQNELVSSNNSGRIGYAEGSPWLLANYTGIVETYPILFTFL